MDEAPGRKLTEFRLQRLNRLHTVLSKIGEAIVRRRNRQELYDAVCRIIVDDGKLRMVYIAEVDMKARVARPAASFGVAQEYLAEPANVIPMDGGPLSLGTVGAVLYTGMHDFCNDIGGASRMKPWREYAMKRGLLANASFPIKLNGATVAVLVLYAGETGYFQGDEIRLMNSVASTLSYALESLEEEQNRQRAESALRQSEESMAKAQRIAHLGSWELKLIDTNDLSANPLLWSEEMYRIAGYEPGAVEVSIEMFFRHVPAGEHEAIREAMAEAIRSNGQYSIVHRLIRPGGEVRIVQATGQISLYGGECEPMRMIGTAHDITELKGTEEALRRSEELIRLITNLVPHGIFAKDASGRHLFANPALAELAGIPVEEIVGKTDFDLVTVEAEAEAYRADDLEVLQSGTRKFIAEEPRTDLSGNTRFLQTIKIPFTLTATGEQAVLGVCMDITERKRLEARFRRLVDSNIQGVIFWNTKGEITGSNEAFLEIVGYTREDLEAGLINWAAMTPPEYVERDKCALKETADTGTCVSYEKEYIRKDGTRVPILVGAAMFEDNPEEGVCFVLDLTERKALEHQFLRAQRMESIGTLAGGIAHDLNNILAPILMSIDILRGATGDPQVTSILEAIGISAQRGADIVRQVLSFARGIEGERIEIQIKNLLNDLENITRDTFPKDIRLRFSAPRDTWTILGDPTQLHQLLLNLCVNARDAMPNGGKLTIGVANVTLDEQYAAMNIQAKPGRYVKISVTDSGSGIPPQLLERIFEPFFTTKEVGKGTGLGLSTVIAIVKSHQGFVNVVSKPGKGTTFEVYLPATDGGSEAVMAEAGGERLPRGSGEMILLVDDEPSLSVVASQTLQAFGYRVLTAKDGAEAMAVYLANRDDVAVVLTDMMMPVMDGPSMIHAMMWINPEVKIIASGGFNANADLAKVSEMRVKYFLTKPYTAEALLKTLRAILEES